MYGKYPAQCGYFHNFDESVCFYWFAEQCQDLMAGYIEEIVYIKKLIVNKKI